MTGERPRREVDLRIATYNVHRCRGMDRRTLPSRIAEVIRSMNADVVALQEVIGAGPAGAGQAEELGAALGMGWVMAPVRHLRNHLFGNVVLSRFPIVHHSQYELTWRTCEARGCQRADLDVGGPLPLHIYNVHLGTAVLERRYQAPRLASFVHDRRVQGPKIILGDFNEWLRGLATSTLSSLFESIDIYAHLKRRRTYPGIFPVLHLDHIYYEGRVEVRGMELVRTRTALMASDHLPLVADLRIGFE
ncbi:MAG: endonuclease/exonuclease/phosphatase family protein [Acidobacteria bacterium]|nr:endonuclease/exonuclease/phosphatase family protein [Acidobacteriota bacterium]MBA3885373.1 endonuclease/exonuclease/phosphatase family protein [Acidobacteriota bacterium]